MVTAAALLLTACGPATYDIDNPEESLKHLSQEEKIEFGIAVQKITMKRMEEENISLLGMLKLSKDPEKMKEFLRSAIDGKTIEEIIEMSK
ncbi:MAG: hypothetical protein IKW19_02445 [Akkermansia sp.]|nr:hypothetical protein [Akkermansia sp.]